MFDTSKKGTKILPLGFTLQLYVQLPPDFILVKSTILLFFIQNKRLDPGLLFCTSLIIPFCTCWPRIPGVLLANDRCMYLTYTLYELYITLGGVCQFSTILWKVLPWLGLEPTACLDPSHCKQPRCRSTTRHLE